ncbi:MAG: oligosaccharide flippase family protein [Candidatus Peribacteria bacterium]|jgi:O-antigen/teichoic acid export membrane protein|nr:oligosaccharide flippase family protein [Candidatus Peribacteria bacterium]
MVHKELLQDETLAKKLITKGFWVYFFAFFSAPIGYILRMFLSNTVSVSEVGVFYSVLGLMGLISSYNDLGLTEAMQYFIPKFWIKGEKAKVRLVIFVSFFMQLLMGILIFFLLYSGADWLALHHFHDPLATQILKILAFYFFGLNIITLCSTMFVSFQDTFSQGLVSAIQQVVNLVFTVVFWATASLTVVSYAWVWIIGVVTAIVTGVSIVALKYREVFKREQKESYSLFSITTGFSKEGKSTLKQHFKYALRVFLVANVASLLGQVDQQVVVNVL